VKLRQAREFLGKGFKLRVRLFYRGREMAHTELGRKLLARLEEDLRDIGHVEMPPKTFGKNVVMLFGPQKAVKPRGAPERGKDVADAKGEDKPLGGKAVQDIEAR